MSYDPTCNILTNFWLRTLNWRGLSLFSAFLKLLPGSTYKKTGHPAADLSIRYFFQMGEELRK
jgi:hypothetical protein